MDPIPQKLLRPLGARCDVVTCFQEPDASMTFEDETARSPSLTCLLCTVHLKHMVDTVRSLPSEEGDTLHSVYARWCISAA